MPRADQSGDSFFFGKLLQPLDHQRLLGHQALELSVPALQDFELAGVVYIQSPAFVWPTKEGLLGNVVPSAWLPNLHPGRLRFAQSPDDLFLGKSFFHL